MPQRQSAPGHFPQFYSLGLQNDIQLQLHARVHCIYQVIDAVDFHDVHVVVIAPCCGPRLHEVEIISAIHELRPAAFYPWMADVEVMLLSKMRFVLVVRNAFATAMRLRVVRLIVVILFGSCMLVSRGWRPV